MIITNYNSNFVLGEHRIDFGIANTESEKIKIYNSRLEIFEAEFPYLLNFDKEYPAQDEFDDYSYLLYSSIDGQIISSCRATPYKNRIWEISNNIRNDLLELLNESEYVQLNRLYIHPRFRNRSLHAHMFYNLSSWVMDNTDYKKYFAVCNVQHVKLYNKLGAGLLVEDSFHLEDRKSDPYYLIHGIISESNKLIKSKFF